MQESLYFSSSMKKESQEIATQHNGQKCWIRSLRQQLSKQLQFNKKLSQNLCLVPQITYQPIVSRSIVSSLKLHQTNYIEWFGLQFRISFSLVYIQHRQDEHKEVIYKQNEEQISYYYKRLVQLKDKQMNKKLNLIIKSYLKTLLIFLITKSYTFCSTQQISNLFNLTIYLSEENLQILLPIHFVNYSKLFRLKPFFQEINTTGGNVLWKNDFSQEDGQVFIADFVWQDQIGDNWVRQQGFNGFGNFNFVNMAMNYNQRLTQFFVHAKQHQLVHQMSILWQSQYFKQKILKVTSHRQFNKQLGLISNFSLLTLKKLRIKLIQILQGTTLSTNQQTLIKQMFHFNHQFQYYQKFLLVYAVDIFLGLLNNFLINYQLNADEINYQSLMRIVQKQKLLQFIFKGEKSNQQKQILKVLRQIANLIQIFIYQQQFLLFKFESKIYNLIQCLHQIIDKPFKQYTAINQKILGFNLFNKIKTKKLKPTEQISISEYLLLSPSILHQLYNSIKEQSKRIQLTGQKRQKHLEFISNYMLNDFLPYLLQLDPDHILKIIKNIEKKQSTIKYSANINDQQRDGTRNSALRDDKPQKYVSMRLFIQNYLWIQNSNYNPRAYISFFAKHFITFIHTYTNKHHTPRFQLIQWIINICALLMKFLDYQYLIRFFDKIQTIFGITKQLRLHLNQKLSNLNQQTNNKVQLIKLIFHHLVFTTIKNNCIALYKNLSINEQNQIFYFDDLNYKILLVFQQAQNVLQQPELLSQQTLAMMKFINQGIKPFFMLNFLKNQYRLFNNKVEMKQKLELQIQKITKLKKKLQNHNLSQPTKPYQIIIVQFYLSQLKIFILKLSCPQFLIKSIQRINSHQLPNFTNQLISFIRDFVQLCIFNREKYQKIIQFLNGKAFINMKKQANRFNIDVVIYFFINRDKLNARKMFLTTNAWTKHLHNYINILQTSNYTVQQTQNQRLILLNLFKQSFQIPTNLKGNHYFNTKGKNQFNVEAKNQFNIEGKNQFNDKGNESFNVKGKNAFVGFGERIIKGLQILTINSQNNPPVYYSHLQQCISILFYSSASQLKRQIFITMQQLQQENTSIIVLFVKKLIIFVMGQNSFFVHKLFNNIKDILKQFQIYKLWDQRVGQMIFHLFGKVFVHIFQQFKATFYDQNGIKNQSIITIQKIFSYIQKYLIQDFATISLDNQQSIILDEWPIKFLLQISNISLKTYSQILYQLEQSKCLLQLIILNQIHYLQKLKLNCQQNEKPIKVIKYIQKLCDIIIKISPYNQRIYKFKLDFKWACQHKLFLDQQLELYLNGKNLQTQSSSYTLLRALQTTLKQRVYQQKQINRNKKISKSFIFWETSIAIIQNFNNSQTKFQTGALQFLLRGFFNCMEQVGLNKQSISASQLMISPCQIKRIQKAISKIRNFIQLCLICQWLNQFKKNIMQYIINIKIISILQIKLTSLMIKYCPKDKYSKLLANHACGLLLNLSPKLKIMKILKYGLKQQHNEIDSIIHKVHKIADKKRLFLAKDVIQAGCWVCDAQCFFTKNKVKLKYYSSFMRIIATWQIGVGNIST